MYSLNRCRPQRNWEGSVGGSARGGERTWTPLIMYRAVRVASAPRIVGATPISQWGTTRIEISRSLSTLLDFLLVGRRRRRGTGKCCKIETRSSTSTSFPCSLPRRHQSPPSLPLRSSSLNSHYHLLADPDRFLQNRLLLLPLLKQRLLMLRSF